MKPLSLSPAGSTICSGDGIARVGIMIARNPKPMSTIQSAASMSTIREVSTFRVVVLHIQMKTASVDTQIR